MKIRLLRLNRLYPQGVIYHHIKQYVVGAVHTNTIEGFWRIFKRGVVGTFHKVSKKYFPLYVAEFQFRYNNRSTRHFRSRYFWLLGSFVASCAASPAAKEASILL